MEIEHDLHLDFKHDMTDVFTGSWRTVSSSEHAFTDEHTRLANEWFQSKPYNKKTTWEYFTVPFSSSVHFSSRPINLNFNDDIIIAQ